MNRKGFAKLSLSLLALLIASFLVLYLIPVLADDAISPTYSLNSTNTTVAGTPVKHSLNWSDDVGLFGYIFSFDNCTGNFVNDSFVSFVRENSSDIIIGSTSNVGNCTQEGISNVNQRKIFYANGRFWIFYSNGTYIAYRTSTDGSSWNNETSIRSGGAQGFSVFFDGTFLHYAYGGYTNLTYRRGTPNSDGSITWSADEQNVSTTYNQTDYNYVSVDSNGYAWISYRDAQPGGGQPTLHTYVVKSGNNDGTWGTTPNGFPYLLITGGSVTYYPLIIPLTSGKMLAIYSTSATDIRSKAWNGTDWGSAKTLTIVPQQGYYYSAVAEGDNVHLVALNYSLSAPYKIVYTKYSYDTNSWSSDTLVQGNVSESPPILSRDTSNNDLYCFWTNASTNNVTYYKRYNGTNWDTSPTSFMNIKALYLPRVTTGFYQSYGNYIGVAIENSTSVPYNIVFNFLDLNLKKAWSNVTKTINSTIGCNIRWCVYANDTSNNWNGTSCSDPFAYATTDGTPPTYSNNQTNDTSSAKPVNFSLDWTDNVGLSGYIFSTNNTGTWTNSSWTSFSGAQNTSSNISFLNSTIGSIVQWMFYANDSSNNWNTSNIYNLTTNGTSGCNIMINNQSVPYTISQSNKVYCLIENIGKDNSNATLFASGVQNTTLDCLNYKMNSNKTIGIGIYGVFSTGSSTKNNTIKNCNITRFFIGISIQNTNVTLINNTAFNNSNIGISLSSSFATVINNDTLINNTANNNDGTGIQLWYRSNSTLINNTVNNNNQGIYVYYANNDTLINNTANNNTLYGFWLNSGSQHVIVNNTANNNSNSGILLVSNINITGNTLKNNKYGITIQSSNNNITGGSIDSSTTYDYNLDSNSQSSTLFINNNFTNARTIYFKNNANWFNYRNDSTNNIWLKTNVSSASTITRTLVNWNQTLMQWNDTNSTASVTAGYNISGLDTNKYYLVYNKSALSYILQTDSSGNLPSFTIALNDQTNMTVQEDQTPPIYYSNQTNETSANKYCNFTLNWNDSSQLGGYIFSSNNSGTWLNSSYISFSGTSNTSWNVTLLNSTIGTMVAWCFYANDSNGNINETSCSSPFYLNTTDSTPPTYTSNVSATVAVYNPSNYSNFSITWNDNSGSLYGAYLENNFSGSLTNTSMLGSYANGYYYNSSVLGANTYQYRFVANDSSGNTNVTPILYFTIAQAPTNISLYLNETENNYSYTQNSVANFTVTVNISGKIVNLTSNYTGWIEQYNTTPLYNYTTLSTLGNFWNITGFFEGDENYSASSKTYYFNVTDVSPPEWSNNVTSIASGSQYSSGQSYQFNVTWNESESSISVVLIEHNFTGGATPHNETVSNESSVYYFSVNDLATGTYVWKEYANNTEDYWNVTNNGNYWSYTITSLVQPITSLSNEPYVPSTVNKIVLTKGNVSIIIPSIAYGKIARISIARYEDVALRQMNIDVVNSANNIKITITKLSDLPSSINKILARVYHYINIEKTNITDSDIRMVNISFAVNKTWLIANNVDASNVTFYRWADNKWNDLNAIKVSEDDREVFYTASSPGLSVFVIGTKGVGSEAPTVAAIACTESWQCTQWSACTGTHTRICTDSNNCGTTTNKPAESESCTVEAEIEKPISINWSIVGIVVIIIVSLISIFVFRNNIVSKLSGKNNKRNKTKNS